MSFAEVRLESDFIVYGTVGGPAFSTSIVVVNSGFEFRNKNWANARGRWEFGSRKMPSKEIHNTLGFFRARGGRFQGFRFKDYADYTATSDPLTEWGVTTQGCFIYLGTTTAQLTKSYVSGSDTDFRKIAKPVQGTIAVFNNGSRLTETVDYTIDYTTGVVTFAFTLPESGMTWDGEFDTPVRFDTDEFKAELIAGESGFTDPPSLTESYYFLQSLPLVEIRV